eukprot:553919-Pelagomonas_calceolata.AAC.3
MKEGVKDHVPMNLDSHFCRANSIPAAPAELFLPSSRAHHLCKTSGQAFFPPHTHTHIHTCARTHTHTHLGNHLCAPGLELLLQRLQLAAFLGHSLLAGKQLLLTLGMSFLGLLKTTGKGRMNSTVSPAWHGLLKIVLHNRTRPHKLRAQQREDRKQILSRSHTCRKQGKWRGPRECHMQASLGGCLMLRLPPLFSSGWQGAAESTVAADRKALQHLGRLAVLFKLLLLEIRQAAAESRKTMEGGEGRVAAAASQEALQQLGSREQIG